MRNLKLPSEIIDKLGVTQVEDVTDKLPINPKNSWAQLAGVRDLDDLTTIVLHHDAWPKKNTTTKYTDMGLATKIATDHINNTSYDDSGEGGMPYHIWIRSGRIYQCNSILDRTYGVGGHNPYTVHICVSGDYFNFDTLTDADRNALYAAVLLIKGCLPKIKAIKGHGELNPTSCPGYDMNRIRSDITTIENQIAYAKSDDNAKAVAYKIANQILYLANMVNGKSADGTQATDGNREWAKQMLLQLEPFMKERSLL